MTERVNGRIEKCRQAPDLSVDSMEFKDCAHFVYRLAAFTDAESEAERIAESDALDHIDKALRRWAFGNRD